MFSVLLLMMFSANSKAQYASEEDLKTSANKMFAEENYVGSIKLFSQLLSTYPKDPGYNYKYGACLLFGARDKEDALRYLKFSVTKPNVDPIAFYFLAKAYHHNYQFSPAIVNYKKYKGKSSIKEHKKYNLDRQVEMCKNGQQLINSMTDIGVLSKKEIRATDFFRSYSLNGIGGKIIVKPDDFRTKLDRKNDERSVIYLGEKKKMVVYSSYGKTGVTGKDIYKVIKLPSGDWSKPTAIGNGINTEFDEDYPFLHPDGITLYFSSKGYNSMGGYDIFKSKLNPQTGIWSYPENLDFPINTPDDDILYISDIDNDLAYFASSRASKQGELTVYNVTVDASPAENSVIKGFFLAESNPSMKSATITVKDAEKDKRYGVFKTHDLTGEYLLTFPRNGGRFKILVETTKDSPVHSAIIELPKLDGFRSLKQELRLVEEGDNEKLVIKNLFDETDEFDIDDPLFVQNIIKQRAKLEVNTTKEEFENTLANNLKDTIEESQEEIASIYKDFSDDRIVNKTEETVAKIIDQAKESKEQSNTSYQLASEKSVLAKKLYRESNNLKANGDLKQAESKKIEAAKLVNEVVAALEIAKMLTNEAIERESDVEKVKSLQGLINKSIDNGNRTESETNLEELEKIASATYNAESALDVEGKLVETKLSEKQTNYNESRDNVAELQNREYELAETINKLEVKKEATKKNKDKTNIEARIEVLKIDVEDAKFDLEQGETKSEKSKKEYNEVKNEVTATKTIIAAVLLGNDNPNLIKETSKIQLENDITYFKKEGLVGLYPSTETELIDESVEIYSLEEHKDEYNVIDDFGNIIDYNTVYSSELAEIDNSETPKERSKQVIEINESWIGDIDEEITIRTKQLGTAKEADKVKFEDEITSLKTLKSEKKSEISTNKEILANANTSTVISENVIEENNPSTTITSKNLAEEANIINSDATIIDYESKYTNELEALTGEDNYDLYSKKASIHDNWANATEQEVLIKKGKLTEANEEDKNVLKNEIAILENKLSEQQDFSALYESKAEEIKNSNSIVTTTKDPLTNNESTEQILTINDLNEIKNEYSNLEYNNDFDYNSLESKKTLESIGVLKAEIKTLKKDAEVKMNTLNNTSSQEEKDVIIAEAEELVKKSNRKQAEISRVYEAANRNEYKNNQQIIEKLRAQNDSSEGKEIDMSEVLAESDNYFEEAKKERLNGANSEDQIIKEKSLQNAYELEIKAIKKQKTAITQLLAENIDEVYADGTSTNNDTEITSEERDVLLNLQSAEITAIKNSEEYKNYAELVAEKRTLIKDAEVEYVESLAREEDASDQEQLGVRLKAMAADADTEEDRVKKLAQLELLADMITKNDTKSEELKSSAENKENKAKEVSDKSDFVLSNLDEVDAENIVVIEKVETFDSDLMEEAMSRTPTIAAEELLESNKEIINDTELAAVPDNYETKYTEKLTEIGGEDSYEQCVKKAEVHYEWAKDIEDEIADKKVALSGANEVDKNEIENEILVLENTLSEQQEFTASYKTRAEKMKTTDSVSEEPLSNNNDTITVEEPVSNDSIEGLTETIEELAIDSGQVDNLNVEEEFVNNSNQTNIDEIPEVLDQSIFVMNNNKAAYNDSKRIPVSPKMPEGLVFKVQIGAFRNPIPQAHFKGFAPIMAEDAGNGITRYTAGLFKTFNMANEAKKAVREIGYSDAFVVVFYNGKRISMTKARALLAETNTNGEDVFTLNPNNVSENNKPTPAESSVATPIATEEVKDGVSTDVRNIDGVFYAIQVGVYSKPVTAGQLNNVSPLNSERTVSGLIRYTSGIYKTLAEANIAKERIRALGITDAFVVAYNRGSKIKVIEAITLLEVNTTANEVIENPIKEVEDENISAEKTNENSDTINKNPIINKVPTEENNVTTPIDEVENPEKAFKNNENEPGYNPKEDLELEFRVKLGEYEEDVPVNDAGIYLKLIKRGIKNYKIGGKTIYVIGIFPDYKSALDLQIEMKEMGVEKPETIVFKDGVEIKLEEALELMKNNQ